MAKLRERSVREGLSINDAALRALERGLGEGGDDRWLALGPLLETAPTTQYDPERLRSLREGITTRARDLEHDLDWVRGETG